MTKIVASSIFGVVVCSLVLWGLVKLPMLANNDLAIKVRHYYYLVMRRDWSESATGIEAVQKMTANGETIYAYTMEGDFLGADSETQILMLKTPKGETFGFRYSLDYGSNLTYRTKGTTEFKSVTAEPLAVGEKITVQWTDKRKLIEVLAEAENDQQKLVNPNLTEDDFVLVI